MDCGQGTWREVPETGHQTPFWRQGPLPPTLDNASSQMNGQHPLPLCHLFWSLGSSRRIPGTELMDLPLLWLLGGRCWGWSNSASTETWEPALLTLRPHIVRNRPPPPKDQNKTKQQQGKKKCLGLAQSETQEMSKIKSFMGHQET